VKPAEGYAKIRNKIIMSLSSINQVNE